jgi:hypothetical protein
MSTPIPDSWTDLKLLLREAVPGVWLTATAWAVGGGDPQGFDIRVKGGRAVYQDAWCVPPPPPARGDDRVRLGRVEPRQGRPHEVFRFVSPDKLLEIRRRP